MNTESQEHDKKPGDLEPFKGARVKRPLLHISLFYILSVLSAHFAFFFYLTLTLVQRVGPEEAKVLLEDQTQFQALLDGLTGPIHFELSLAAQSLPMVISLLCWRFFFNGRVSDLGLSTELRSYGDLLGGLLLGVSLTLSVVGAGLISGGMTWVGINEGSVFLRDGLLMGLDIVLLHAFCEEVIFRGYLFQLARHNWGPSAAVLLSSAFFAVAHAANPGQGILPILGTAAAGILFGLLTLRQGHIWTAVGAHAAWNMFIGPIFNFPVSGLEMDGVLGFSYAEGFDWLLGGAYGPEGGLAGILALGLAAAVLFNKMRESDIFKQGVPEAPAPPSEGTAP